jgi:mono/diheme cytochrome c family protein
VSAARAALAAGVALLIVNATSANAAEKTLSDKGEVLVKENCSRCHAIGKEGDSPHKEAPPLPHPFRQSCRLARRRNRLRASGHADLRLQPARRRGIIEYLQSIQAQ